MREVLYCQKLGLGYIARCRSNTGSKAQVNLSEVRGAIVRPLGPVPGYYLFMGVKPETTLHGDKNPLLYLCEGREATQRLLIDKMADDAARMQASVVYADDGHQSEAQGFFRDLWNYSLYRRGIWRLLPAPSVQDYDYGIGLIRDYAMDGAIDRPPLDITHTELAEQITSIRDDTDITETDLYAFHAFRQLLAGIVRDRPRIPQSMLESSFEHPISVPDKTPAGPRGAML